jgi:gamma-glutamyl phosphate reductase
MPTIYAIALGSRDGDTITELKMANGAKDALEAVKELASKHIAYVLAGEEDAQQFVDAINASNAIDQALSRFDDAMQEAHDREVENAYSAELVIEALEA